MTTCWLSQSYAPQVADVSNGLTPPNTSEPTIVDVDQIVLTFPVVSPTLTLTIRNPKLGNTIEIHQNRINRQTRGLKRLVYRNPIWPQWTTLHYSFEALSETNVADLLAFYAASLGQNIGLLDFESQQWTGIIEDPNVPIVKIGIGCQFDTEFSFLGSL